METPIKLLTIRSYIPYIGILLGICLIGCSTVKWENKPQYFVVDQIVQDTIYRVSIHDGEWITRIYYAETDSVWALGDTLILRRK